MTRKYTERVARRREKDIERERNEQREKKNVQKEVRAIKGWQLIYNLPRPCISVLSRQEKTFPGLVSRLHPS